MNLHITQPWQRPLFVRRTILPFFPFAACTVVLLMTAGVADFRSHKTLIAAQQTLPAATGQADSTRYLTEYNEERIALKQIYDAQATTLQTMRSLSAITSILPKSMRLTKITFPQDTLGAINITAELLSPQDDVAQFLRNVEQRNWRFHLTSLTPITHTYQIAGDLTITTLPTASQKTKLAAPHKTAVTTPAHQKQKHQ